MVGGSVPEPSPDPWVFVRIPKPATEAPSFYVLTQAELFDILNPVDAAYRRNYLAKHGEEFGARRGVVKLSREAAERYRDRWETIIDLLKKVPSAR